MRLWVKSVFQNIGFVGCRELLKDFEGFGLSDRYFYNTFWLDIVLREFVRKKMRYRFKLYCCSFCNYLVNVFVFFRNYLNYCYEDEVD